MDLATLVLVLDGGVKQLEARFPDGETAVGIALRGMRDTALALLPASTERRDALLTELIEEVAG